MNVTINDSFFVSTNDNLKEDLKRLADLKNAKIGDIHFYRREKMDFSFVAQNNKLFLEQIVVIGSIKSCPALTQNHVINKTDVRPNISGDILADVLACSIDKDIHHIVTVGNYDLVDTEQFEIANVSLFPSLISGNYSSEEALFSEFKKISDIEISRESNETMQQYGKQREAVIYDNVKVQMTLHLKINDARIYIYPLDDKIYVGHCGKHLQTKKYH